MLSISLITARIRPIKMSVEKNAAFALDKKDMLQGNMMMAGVSNLKRKIEVEFITFLDNQDCIDIDFEYNPYFAPHTDLIFLGIWNDVLDGGNKFLFRQQ